jgi:hypothetical protein
VNDRKFTPSSPEYRGRKYYKNKLHSMENKLLWKTVAYAHPKIFR